MEKTKMRGPSWVRTPNAFYVSIMRTTDDRAAEVESENQQWIGARLTLHNSFTDVDDAYQRTVASLSTASIAEKDEERDVWGQVIEQVAKQWARMPDATMNIHGRRVLQVFRDIDFRTSEAIVAENEKILNIEQAFQGADLTADLEAMGLTAANTRFKTLTNEIIALVAERNEESASRVKGELAAAREAMDAVYADFVELTNALIVLGNNPELETYAAVVNADIKHIEEQMAQSKKQPTVLVKSEVVGNHRYSVPEFATWADIVSANEKAFAVDAATGHIVSLAPKAKKVGGLYLTLAGTAVKETDTVDAKKEYALVENEGGGDVTPVTPE